MERLHGHVRGLRGLLVVGLPDTNFQFGKLHAAKATVLTSLWVIPLIQILEQTTAHPVAVPDVEKFSPLKTSNLSTGDLLRVSDGLIKSVASTERDYQATMTRINAELCVVGVQLLDRYAEAGEEELAADLKRYKVKVNGGPNRVTRQVVALMFRAGRLGGRSVDPATMTRFAHAIAWADSKRADAGIELDKLADAMVKVGGYLKAAELYAKKSKKERADAAATNPAPSGKVKASAVAAPTVTVVSGTQPTLEVIGRIEFTGGPPAEDLICLIRRDGTVYRLPLNETQVAELRATGGL